MSATMCGRAEQPLAPQATHAPLRSSLQTHRMKRGSGAIGASSSAALCGVELIVEGAEEQ